MLFQSKDEEKRERTGQLIQEETVNVKPQRLRFKVEFMIHQFAANGEGLVFGVTENNRMTVGKKRKSRRTQVD